MVLDYRERKPVNKNRPKSKPVGLYLVAFGAVAGCFFVLGVVTDRYLLPPRTSATANAPKAPAPAPAPPAPQAAAGSASGADQHSVPPPEPSLTFYETLPKGGKAILGSGINPKRPEAHDTTAKPGIAVPVNSSPAAPQQPEARPAIKTEPPQTLPAVPPNRTAAADTAERQQSSDAAARDLAAKKTATTKGKYVVQVASVKERNEAESIKKVLQEKGFAAYIVESSVVGKGTWYRVRVGKQMDQSAAGSLVKQIGGGAIIISE
uniref:SPOR domain-containing protein n=1 Tax=Geobacter metallireducens TaxID=28232 RepID=A0A831UBN8_GEOME